MFGIVISTVILIIVTYTTILSAEDSTFPRLHIDQSSVISPEMLSLLLIGKQRNDKEAIYNLGLLHQYGLAMPKNISLAFENFKLAADLGLVDAQTACGVLLLQHNDLGSIQLARKYLTSAADANDANAQLILAKHYLQMQQDRSILTSQELIKVREYLDLASRSDSNQAEAYHYLGLMYEYGLGTTQDFLRAMEFYKLAVDLKSSESMYNLALMYAYGRGTPQDFSRAGSLFHAAALAGHAPSMYYLGVMRTYGYGVEVDYHKALEWFQKAMKADDVRILQKASDSLKEIETRLEEARIHKENIGNMYPKVALDENGMPVDIT